MKPIRTQKFRIRVKRIPNYSNNTSLDAQLLKVYRTTDLTMTHYMLDDKNLLPLICFNKKISESYKYLIAEKIMRYHEKQKIKGGPDPEYINIYPQIFVDK